MSGWNATLRAATGWSSLGRLDAGVRPDRGRRAGGARGIARRPADGHGLRHRDEARRSRGDRPAVRGQGTPARARAPGPRALEGGSKADRELRRTRRGARAPLLGRPAHDRAAASRARTGVGPRRRSADDRRPDAARPARARGAGAHGAARGEQREPQRRAHALDLRRGRGGVRRRGRGVSLRSGTARRLGLDRRSTSRTASRSWCASARCRSETLPMRCETSLHREVPRTRCRLASPWRGCWSCARATSAGHPSRRGSYAPPSRRG